MKDFYTLGIESSCDDTSASVLKNRDIVLSNCISSQIDIHKKYGGVVPEIASRKHIENIDIVVNASLNEANVSLHEIDLISVSYGPGLVGSLIVGLSFAKALSFGLDVPFVGINHIEGHICALYIEYPDIIHPFLSLVVSGGHSMIVLVKDYMDFEIISSTRDDAAGEVFDKVARKLNLGYPGGPIIDKISKFGDISKYKFPETYFDNLDFSFSGIKTSVINTINTLNNKNISYKTEDIVACFQNAIVNVLVNNIIKASIKKNIPTISIVGGVSSNSLLKSRLRRISAENNIIFYDLKPQLCTDNAAMIAVAGYYSKIYKKKSSDLYLNANPNLKI